MIPPASTTKRQVHGTHRTRPPQETFALVRPLLLEAGITRIADVTWLDDVGIPTYQAIRPASRSLSVSQGKGISVDLARVSAVMESLELWASERIATHRPRGSIAEMSEQLTYDTFALLQPRPSLLCGETILEWLPARTLEPASTRSFVPFDYVDMDATVGTHWGPSLLSASSNGLASGNTVDEATAHGLYEVIERDCTTGFHALASETRTEVDPSTVIGDSRAVVELFHRAGNRVEIFDARNAMAVPCFVVHAWSPTFPIRVTGAGCHLDPDVALCRALTEAAQARLTLISGSRDDLKASILEVLRDNQGSDYAAVSSRPVIGFNAIISEAGATLAADVADLAGRIIAFTGVAPLAVDLGNPDWPIAVVKVVAPGLRFDEKG